ncbi:hypothetical protein JFP838_pD0046 (plasmid) [Clostridium perfringens]|uniref:Uncharacterized protein n=1 Tax=Clostridium perfringens TaxID=1502 RepID=A0A140GPW0_CLOPF|nr:hypothetical protein JFP838_pD0046 [Clostridium perfringens]
MLQTLNSGQRSFRRSCRSRYYKRGNILKNTSRLGGTQTKKKMMEFLDLTFPRRKDKNAILNVFKKNEWR